VAVVEPVELPVASEAFLTHLVVEKGRAPLTLDAYRRDLRRWVVFLGGRGTEVLDAGPEDVAAFSASLRDEGLAPASVTRTLVAVRSMHRWLAAEGLAPSDPTAEMETPRRPQSLPKALSEEQVVAILDAVGAAAGTGDPVALRDAALLEFLYGTGARISEACGLGFGGLDLDAGLVRLLGKRSKERIVPVGGRRWCRPAGGTATTPTPCSSAPGAAGWAARPRGPCCAAGRRSQGCTARSARTCSVTAVPPTSSSTGPTSGRSRSSSATPR